MSQGYLILTDLATPDDTDLRVLASSIVAFGNDSRTHGDDFVTHFGYVDLVGGHTKLVCESADEIQEKMIELYRFMEDSQAVATEEQQAIDDAFLKAMGLDAATIEAGTIGIVPGWEGE